MIKHVILLISLLIVSSNCAASCQKAYQNTRIIVNRCSGYALVNGVTYTGKAYQDALTNAYLYEDDTWRFIKCVDDSYNIDVDTGIYLCELLYGME